MERSVISLQIYGQASYPNRDLLAERRLGDDFEGREEIADKFGQHGDFAKQHFQRGAMIEHDLAVLLRDVDPRFDPRLLVLLAVLLDRVFAGLDRAVLLVDPRVQNRVLHDDEAERLRMGRRARELAAECSLRKYAPILTGFLEKTLG